MLIINPLGKKDWNDDYVDEQMKIIWRIEHSAKHEYGDENWLEGHTDTQKYLYKELDRLEKLYGPVPINAYTAHVLLTGCYLEVDTKSSQALYEYLHNGLPNYALIDADKKNVEFGLKEKMEDDMDNIKNMELASKICNSIDATIEGLTKMRSLITKTRDVDLLKYYIDNMLGIKRAISEMGDSLEYSLEIFPK